MRDQPGVPVGRVGPGRRRTAGCRPRSPRCGNWLTGAYLGTAALVRDQDDVRGDYCMNRALDVASRRLGFMPDMSWQPLLDRFFDGLAAA